MFEYQPMKAYRRILNFGILLGSRSNCLYHRGKNIVTCIPIARQRLGKHVPAGTDLGKQPVAR
jgi:hypothetical protein